MTQNSFQPPLRTLMGPGPSDVNPRILEAMSRPTIGHLDPEFIRMMDEVKDLIRYAFQSDYALAMPVSAPGSAGMETCFVNLLEPGDKVVICQNGVFGVRMKENVERSGATAVMVEDEWGQPIDPNKANEALKANPDAKILAFVHAETSTGAISDVQTLGKIAKDNNCLAVPTRIPPRPSPLSAIRGTTIWSAVAGAVKPKVAMATAANNEAKVLINYSFRSCRTWPILAVVLG